MEPERFHFMIAAIKTDPSNKTRPALPRGKQDLLSLRWSLGGWCKFPILGD